MRERPETLRTDTPWMTTNIPDISLVGLRCFESQAVLGCTLLENQSFEGA